MELKKGKINLKLTIVIFLTLIFGITIFLSYSVLSADQTNATYTGSDQCTLCHSNKFNSWSNTNHGIDFANEWLYNGDLTNKYTYCGDSMLPCHTVGYDEIDKKGYDPSYDWDSAENAHLLGIGCENCHGPGSEHIDSSNEDKIGTINQIVDRFAESCGGSTESVCHGGNRQYGNETIIGWKETNHATVAPEEAKRLGCSHCLSTEGAIAKLEGNPLTEISDEITWSITCAVCHDPHPDSDDKYDRQLRTSAEVICEECHYTTSVFGDEEVHHPTKELRYGMGGIDVAQITFMEDINCIECHMYTSPRGTPVQEAKQGHSWIPQPENCANCHDGETVQPEYNISTAQEKIDELKNDFTNVYNNVKINIDLMKERKDYAEDNSIWTSQMNETYYEAIWNFGLAEGDGSNGIHNPFYAEALMLNANTKALDVIESVNNAPVPGDGTPGFEVFIFLLAIYIAFFIFYKRKIK